MRVLLCKIQCPSFICFSKPSTSTHIYASGSLRLENTPGVSSSKKGEDCTLEEKQEETHGEIILKSSFKKEALDSAVGERMEEEKKKVQWVDLMGKELAEIREFECREEDDIRYDGDRSCVCIIL
ncbi:hypothetical protein Rs2_47230 [Raphanus sativus]|nr:hypothetical protein Rs2_47230 [Raphanus sativus]